MSRSRFEKELDELNLNIIKLGGLAEQAIDISIDALTKQDVKLAETVTAHSKEISRIAGLVEADAMKILLRQQPVASDLRIILTALKMVADLDRIGAQSRDIGSIVLHLCEEEYTPILSGIPLMAEKTKSIVSAGIDCFVRQDPALAAEVLEMDNEIDQLFLKIKDNMIKMIQKQPEYADQAIYLMMVAKYLEKIGDHAENIAAWVIFCKTGEKTNIKY